MTISQGTRAQAKAKTQFLRALDTAVRIYTPAREMCRYNGESFNETTYHPNVAAKVTGLAFLSAVAAWDDFVEEVYLGYLCGYAAPNGYKPQLLAGPAQNKTHALKLAAGESNLREAERKLRWSSFKWVQSLSTVHFAQNNVFAEVLAQDVAWLDLAQIIRNRVAHNSVKAKSQFKTALNRLVDDKLDAPLPRGFSPGKFLIYRTERTSSSAHSLRIITIGRMSLRATSLFGKGWLISYAHRDYLVPTRRVGMQTSRAAVS